MRIWLTGDVHGELFQYDPATGEHVRLRISNAGPTAGNAQFVGGKLVATYVGADGQDVFIQIGTTVYPVDGGTRATRQVTWRGLMTTLVVERPGLPTTRLTQWRTRHLLPRLFDPTWDELDELVEDASIGIVELVNSVEALERYRSLKSHTAGPW